MEFGRRLGRVACSVHACYPLQQLWSLAFGSRNSFDARRRACVFSSCTHAAMAEKVAGSEGTTEDTEDTAAWSVASRWRSSPSGRRRQGNAGGLQQEKEAGSSSQFFAASSQKETSDQREPAQLRSGGRRRCPASCRWANEHELLVADGYFVIVLCPGASGNFARCSWVDCFVARYGCVDFRFFHAPGLRKDWRGRTEAFVEGRRVGFGAGEHMQHVGPRVGAVATWSCGTEGRTCGFTGAAAFRWPCPCCAFHKREGRRRGWCSGTFRACLFLFEDRGHKLLRRQARGRASAREDASNTRC